MYLAIDEGTTKIKAILFDDDFRIICREEEPLSSIYPREGWVEQNPNEIWKKVRLLVHRIFERHGKTRAIGITNQRETTILWDSRTGREVYNAIVWQCRRTSGMLEGIAKEHGDEIIKKTGLEIDPYFSASKIRWILENVPKARDLLIEGRLMFGTVDSYLLWKLTGGKVHATDHTNASRTMLYNIHRGEWDDSLLEIFGVPREILPEIMDSSSNFGEVSELGVPITGVIGDQQSALLAHGCTSRGEMKITYGTGTFMLVNTSSEIYEHRGILSTVAWSIDSSRTFALEGSILTSGTVVEWLKSLGLWSDEVGEETDLFFVPAFSGLGSPYWDPEARGMIIGITPYTTKEHITRAALEAVAFMVKDVISEMEKHVDLKEIRADGGMSRNEFLRKFQADIIGVPVKVPDIHDMTARGVALLSAVGNGDVEFGEIEPPEYSMIYRPSSEGEWASRRYRRWREAVRRSMRWASHDGLWGK